MRILMTSVCGKRGLVGPGLAVSDIVDKAAAPWTRVRMLEIMEQPPCKIMKTQLNSGKILR